MAAGIVVLAITVARAPGIGGGPTTAAAGAASSAIPAPSSSLGPVLHPGDPRIPQIAEQQIAKYWPHATVVPCAANMPTYPPLLAQTGGAGGQAGFHVLIDGRCIFDPTATPVPVGLVPGDAAPSPVP